MPAGPELLIVGLFFLVIPFLTAFWGDTDAEKRGDDRATFWALAVGGLTGFGGLPALAVYLWQRD